MPKKNRFAFSASCSFSEKFVACFARCGFNRDLPFRGESADIRDAKLEINARIDLCRASAALTRSPSWQAQRLPYSFSIVARGEFFDEPRVGIAHLPAQLMVQMAEDHFLVTKIDQPV